MVLPIIRRRILLEQILVTTREDRAVNRRIWQQAVIQQVHERHATIGHQLHDLPLEDLHREAHHREGRGYGVAKGPLRSAALEELPELIVIDALASLSEVAGVGRLRADGWYRPEKY